MNDYNFPHKISVTNVSTTEVKVRNVLNVLKSWCLFGTRTSEEASNEQSQGGLYHELTRWGTRGRHRLHKHVVGWHKWVVVRPRTGDRSWCRPSGTKLLHVRLFQAFVRSFHRGSLCARYKRKRESPSTLHINHTAQHPFSSSEEKLLGSEEIFVFPHIPPSDHLRIRGNLCRTPAARPRWRLLGAGRLRVSQRGLAFRGWCICVTDDTTLTWLLCATGHHENRRFCCRTAAEATSCFSLKSKN